MQPALFNTAPGFGGPDLTPADEVRLTGHLQKVVGLMSDGRWRTLAEIAAAVGCSEASSSARLRDLRAAKHGGFTVEKKRLTAGIWLYRVQP